MRLRFLVLFLVMVAVDDVKVVGLGAWAGGGAGGGAGRGRGGARGGAGDGATGGAGGEAGGRAGAGASGALAGLGGVWMGLGGDWRARVWMAAGKSFLVGLSGEVGMGGEGGPKRVAWLSGRWVCEGVGISSSQMDGVVPLC